MTTTTTPTVPVLFIDTNGRVACANHGGYALTAALERGITASEVVHGITTDLTHWMPYDADRVANAGEDVTWMQCEKCGARL